jgi:hypothetical protein
MSRVTVGKSTKDTSSDTMSCITPEYRKEDSEQSNCGAEHQGHQQRHQRAALRLSTGKRIMRRATRSRAPRTPAATPGAAPCLSTGKRIMSRATVGQSTKDTSSDTRGLHYA